VPTEIHTDLMVRIERSLPSQKQPQVQFVFPTTLTQALAIWQTESQKSMTRKVDLYVRASSWSRT
jgi:hypothetical protein